MSPAERRRQIMDVLSVRRSDTAENLAVEFGVSERTIRRDIEELTLRFPLETVRGGHGGGIRLCGWYRPYRRTLSPEQAAALRRAVRAAGTGEDAGLLQSILTQFSTAV